MAQGRPINVGLAAGLPLPIGQTSTVTVSVQDISNSSVLIVFVGLRFDWNKLGDFYIGGNSEKGAILAATQQVTYKIPVAIPDNVTPGTCKLTTYVSYRLSVGGNWTGAVAALWASDVPLAYPKTQSQQTGTQSQVQTQSTSGQGRTQQTYSLLTYGIVAIAALVIIVGIALYIGRVRRVEENRKTSSKPGFEEPPKVFGDGKSVRIVRESHLPLKTSCFGQRSDATARNRAELSLRM